MPSTLVDLVKESEKVEDTERRPLSSISKLTKQIYNLLASIRNASLSPLEVFYRCLSIERQLAAWSVDHSVTGCVYALKEPSSTHSTAWSLYRCARIITNRLMLNHLPGSEAHQLEQTGEDAQRKICNALVSQLTSDICTTAKFQIENIVEFRVCDALSLIYPLAVAAFVQRRSNNTEMAAIEHLEHLGRTWGINYCLFLAKEGSQQYTNTKKTSPPFG